MKVCKILTKVRRVPSSFEKYLEDSDIVFRAHGIFVFVDNEKHLGKPYILVTEIEAVRLDKRVLQELDDHELSVILYQAKIENELKQVLHDEDNMLDELDDVISKRYPDWLINNINKKLDTIYNQVV